MLKQVIIGALATIVLAAGAAGIVQSQANNDTSAGIESISANVDSAVGVAVQHTPGAGTPVGNSQGFQGGRNETAAAGAQANGTAGVHTGTPQATLAEWITLHGVVSAPDAFGFTLLADDGLSYKVDTGNAYYVESIGLTLQDGMTLTVIGTWGVNPHTGEDQLNAGGITLDTGESFVIRDEYGRPMWSGANNGNGQGNGGQGHGQGGQTAP